MIEIFSPDDIFEKTGIQMRVAERISNDDLAVLGQIPTYPAVLSHVQGVLRGDTTITKEYYGIQRVAMNRNATGEFEEMPLRGPDELLAAAQALRGEVPEFDRLLRSHEEFGRSKRAIVNGMREALGLSRLRVGEPQRVDYEPDLVPLYSQELQMVPMALQIETRLDRETNDRILGPINERTRLIVVTDTSETTEGTHIEIVEGDPSEFTGTFIPNDPRFQRSITPREVADLRSFSEVSVGRVILNAEAFLPELIRLHG